MLARLFPHPVLSLVIAVAWVLLANEVSAGGIVLGVALGLLIPVFTARFWPNRVRLRAPFTILEYGLVVLWDIVVSNIQVAWLILARREASLRTRYVTVPLDITSPEAIVVLAGTITMTPGTVSADISADGRALLVHCLDVEDAEAAVATMKARYERRLKRIFE